MNVVQRISAPSCALTQQKGGKHKVLANRLAKVMRESCIEKVQLRLGAEHSGSCCEFIFRHYVYKFQPVDALRSTVSPKVYFEHTLCWAETIGFKISSQEKLHGMWGRKTRTGGVNTSN